MCGREKREREKFFTMSMLQKILSYLICFFFIYASVERAIAEMKENDIHLPRTVGAWTRPESPQLINSNNIFKYMNGAGELYLSYRFRRLDVFDYVSDSQENILVELYHMETSDDAFGLLSLDWGGEPIKLGESATIRTIPSLTTPVRALYGAGLLRIWSDNLYARVMAVHETPATQKAVLALGQAIAKNRKNPPEPEVLNILPLLVGSAWKIRKDRMNFFHSYLVLNSIYYVSHENILDLDLSTEAVFAPYEQISNPEGRERIQFLLVKYQNQDRALKALHHFHDAYLPEHEKNFIAGSTSKNPSLFKLEDGWLAYKRIGKYITIVFESPDEKSAKIILEKIQPNLLEKRSDHEKS